MLTNDCQNLKVELNETGILTIILARPKALNALNAQLLDELSQVLDEAKNQAAVKALLITGEGEKAFCVGADIHRLADLDATQGLTFATQGQQLFRALEQLGKPSLAAINGYCFGGGCELAMAASMRIAHEKAVFGQPEVKLGVIPCYGGTQRLARLVGKGRAIDLCITGRSINASEALSWGLVTEVTSVEDLLPRAYAILEKILEMAPLAVRNVLEVIDSGYDCNLDEAQRLEALLFAMNCDTKDKDHGVQAFLNKQSPAFIGA